MTSEALSNPIIFATAVMVGVLASIWILLLVRNLLEERRAPA